MNLAYLQAPDRASLNVDDAEIGVMKVCPIMQLLQGKLPPQELCFLRLGPRHLRQFRLAR